MSELNIGIVGTGFIAGLVADSIDDASNARLVAVSSRSLATAEAFVAARPGVVAVEGLPAILARDDVDALFVATPTTSKEAIALAAIAAGKHVLVDKPYTDHASVARMIEAARRAGVVFLDGTHFVHHPRNAAIRAAIPAAIGAPRSLHTAFYFPFGGGDNIRMDTTLEPTGALGDMAWYSMRAVVEYLESSGEPSLVSAAAEYDDATGAIIRATGLVAFEGGETSTFDVGFTAGTLVMDLHLLGTGGAISMDDFVLDWTCSGSFRNPDIKTGYVQRSGMATRREFRFVETPSAARQDVLMIEHLAELAARRDERAVSGYAGATLATQRLLDAIRDALGNG